MKDAPRLFSFVHHDNDYRVTEASGTDLKLSVSLTNSLCFKGTQILAFFFLKKPTGHVSAGQDHIQLSKGDTDGSTGSPGARWVLPREETSGSGTDSTASWCGCVDSQMVCEPAELVLLNTFVTAEYASAASERLRDEGG